MMITDFRLVQIEALTLAISGGKSNCAQLRILIADERALKIISLLRLNPSELSCVATLSPIHFQQSFLVRQKKETLEKPISEFYQQFSLVFLVSELSVEMCKIIAQSMFTETPFNSIEIYSLDCTNEIQIENFASDINQFQAAQQKPSSTASKLTLPASTPIIRFTDTFTNFIALTPTFVSLATPNSFSSFYQTSNLQQPKLNFHEIQSLALRLLSVVIQSNTLPILINIETQSIDSPAYYLTQALRDLLRSKYDLNADKNQTNQDLSIENDSSDSFSRSNDWMNVQWNPHNRPLLLVCDRTLDCVPMLLHTWTYEALCCELLEMDESLCVSLPNLTDRMKTQSFMLNQDDDHLWQQMRSLSFPEVAEHIQIELKAYQEACAQVSGTSDESSSSALGSLVGLQRRKEVLDMHTTIASALLDLIQARSLDIFVQLEDKLLLNDAQVRRFSKSSNPVHPASVSELLQSIEQPKDGQKRTIDKQDSVRLLAIYALLFQHKTSHNESTLLYESLKRHGASLETCLSALNAVSLRETEPSVAQATKSQIRESSDGLLTTKGVLSGMMAHGRAGVAGVRSRVDGFVRSRLSRTRRSQLCDVIESLVKVSLEGQQSTDFKFKVIDTLSVDRNALNQKNGMPKILVFVIGGGNWTEWEDLMQLQKRVGIDVTYVCSEVLSPNQFMAQLMTS
mmetsp:Transcript_783/g.1428  ORF Transcript_783/g.1428 Transcript_783/m.1428 type:complete len:683 (-) Transcript_783:1121-3169(-)